MFEDRQKCSVCGEPLTCFKCFMNAMIKAEEEHLKKLTKKRKSN
jgi:transcription initiation factor IIE alpha subunit